MPPSCSTEQGDWLFTRALILLSLGLPRLALEDAKERETQRAEEGRFLSTYANALFTRFDFWPARESPSSDYDDLPQRPAQPAAKVRAVVLKYLTA